MTGRRSSLWTELRREREQRQRVASQARRVHEQLIRQAAKEHDQAVQRSAREETAERRRQEQLAHEARAAEAAARTAEVEARADELKELLRSSLDIQTHIPFDALKRRVEAVCFDPGVPDQVVPLCPFTGGSDLRRWSAIRCTGITEPLVIEGYRPVPREWTRSPPGMGGRRAAPAKQVVIPGRRQEEVRARARRRVAAIPAGSGRSRACRRASVQPAGCGATATQTTDGRAGVRGR